MDDTAIKAIGDLAIAAGENTKIETGGRCVALPDKWNIHDLEKYQDAPNRFRGTMTTPSIEDFIAYVLRDPDGSNAFAHRAGANAGTLAPNMKATNIFNMGTQDDPDHADNRAELIIPPTPDFLRFVMASTQTHDQSELIDLFEDLGGLASFTTSTGAELTKLAASSGVNAIRKVKVTRKSEREHVHDDFKQTKSALDQVEATSDLGMPSGLLFEGELYEGLGKQSLWARLSLVANDDDPDFRLRIPRLEAALIDAERNLAQILRDRLDGVPVTVGTFTR